jgi:hypothetical protein
MNSSANIAEPENQIAPVLLQQAREAALSG